MAVPAGVRSICRFLRRQRGTLAMWSILIVLASLSFSLAIAPTYTAQARLLVERRADPVLRDATERPLSPFEVTNNLVKILTSRAVVETVVDELRPHVRSTPPSALRRALIDAFQTLDRWGLASLSPPRERYIRRWSRSLMVETSGDMIEIRMSDEDPVRAALVTNMLLDAAIEHYLSLLRPGALSDVRMKLADAVQVDIDAAVRAIDELRENEGSAVKRDALGRWLGRLRLRRDELAREARRAQRDGGSAELDPGAVHELRASIDRAIMETALRLTREGSADARLADLQETLRELGRTHVAQREVHEALRVRDEADRRTVNIRVAGRAETPVMPDSTHLHSLAAALASALVFALGAALIRDRLGLGSLAPERIGEVLGAPLAAPPGSISGTVRSLSRRERRTAVPT